MKFIFVTGGVCSSLGKGLITSSVGLLLKSQGLNVLPKKFDPYFNVDPGVMNPNEHGEVFVTDDGAETDLDLGHYERFMDISLSQISNVTAGVIYKNVIDKERKGDYMGQTVQVVPHITSAIKSKINDFSGVKRPDVCIIEIGGTVGDIELSPFLEAVRQVIGENKKEDTCLIHLGLLPYLFHTSEVKTKPIQHSVKVLNSYGLFANVIVARSHNDLSKTIIRKISNFCNVPTSHVILGKDMNSIYKVPNALKDQKLHLLINQQLNIKNTKINFGNWNNFLNQYNTVEQEVKVAIVGKYNNTDAYFSVKEALQHAGLKNSVSTKINFLDAAQFNEDENTSELKNYDAIVVPGGFGTRDIDGKINAIKYARENNIPFLGLCLGFQLAAIEYLRNVCQLEDVDCLEFNPEAKHIAVGFINNKNTLDKMGGTLRLGAYKCELKKDSLAFKLYQSELISERHRHRYEIIPKYAKMIEEKKQMHFSGSQPNKIILEILELRDHPFFIATQFHPEFKSRPTKPHCLFVGLIAAAIQKNKLSI